MFDQVIWKGGRSVGQKTFFFKKPYLYQASVDMVYSSFLSLFNTIFSPILQWSLGTSCLTKECEKEVAQWVTKLFSSKTISISGRYRYGFLTITTGTEVQHIWTHYQESTKTPNKNIVEISQSLNIRDFKMSGMDPTIAIPIKALNRLRKLRLSGDKQYRKSPAKIIWWLNYIRKILIYQINHIFHKNQIFTKIGISQKSDFHK